MPKYRVVFDYGYGEDEDIVEAESLEEAEMIAYEYWREGAESQANYYAEEIDEQNEEQK